MRDRLLASLLALTPLPALAADLIAFWDEPRHGANSFNRLPPDQAYFDALKGYGASWVRLSYDKWQPAGRDFLLGDADEYAGLAQADLQTLVAVLDRAHRSGLKVVIAPLSLPGMRWVQNNQNQFDDRLWQDKRYWEQSAAFWRDLAKALKDHPAVAAFNLVNEPAPEKRGGLAEHAALADMQRWYDQVQGSARDLPALSATLLEAIRTVDDKTPVMVDAGWYAAADAFGYWPTPLADSRVLYSVHMYEPYVATYAPSITGDRAYAYPGTVPFAAGTERWDKQRVADYLQQPVRWAQQHELPVSRLVVGEFGCMRRLAGCGAYLEDVLAALDRYRLHWAFYAFREDAWDGMDYELGTDKVSWRYWQAVEEGKPDPLSRHPGPLFQPILQRLSPGPQ
ncbi:glycosyl hydrolase [Pseudomonas parafulva]|uniref:Glycosyl hydrolase n=1 Tax=Pseudomonas parafulva TaxID=157782 RepID=A0AAI8PAX7_9PSED|nr:cellulase family glycosylhydrolase [Pseudomonas parafulva]AXO89368.1 glycosyl hydrolase [Pseudomonas parafulva]